MQNNYDEVEMELLIIYELKLKFVFGDIETEEYINALKSITFLAKNVTTKLSLNSVMIQLKLISSIKNNSFSESLEREIIGQLQEIDKIEDAKEVDRHLLKVFFII